MLEGQEIDGIASGALLEIDVSPAKYSTPFLSQGFVRETIGYLPSDVGSHVLALHLIAYEEGPSGEAVPARRVEYPFYATDNLYLSPTNARDTTYEACHSGVPEATRLANAMQLFATEADAKGCASRFKEDPDLLFVRCRRVELRDGNLWLVPLWDLSFKGGTPTLVDAYARFAAADRVVRERRIAAGSSSAAEPPRESGRR